MRNEFYSGKDMLKKREVNVGKIPCTIWIVNRNEGKKRFFELDHEL